VDQSVNLPVELLCPGEWADVTEVTGAPIWVGRMAELGVRIGSRVQVLQPGSPCLLRVGGARLSLRSDEGSQILVRPVAHAG
jgi:Fe2+ transport system protein FeoA